MLQNIFPKDVVIYNGYGPTESTIACCFYQVADIPNDNQAVPIGTPIGGMDAIVLNDEMLPQTQGVPGELYLSGPLLSPGYWNDTERTRISFIKTDLFSEKTLYKTGDKVRVNAEGMLEYIGRFDNQIKRYGIRLELGEVSSAALRHDNINSAVATIKPRQQSCASDEKLDGLGNSGEHLILYYTSISEIDNSILHAHLAQHLPSSSLPDQAVWVEEIPLNTNGKIDILNLPEPTDKHFLRTNSYRAPENEAQDIWQATWMRVLELDLVSITDNFFKIGGNSLLAIKLVSEINTHGYDYTPLDIFRNPTILLLSSLNRRVTSNQLRTTTRKDTPFSQISEHETEKLKNLLAKE